MTKEYIARAVPHNVFQLNKCIRIRVTMPKASIELDDMVDCSGCYGNETWIRYDIELRRYRESKHVWSRLYRVRAQRQSRFREH